MSAAAKRIVADLEKALGPRVRTNDTVLAAHSRDTWMLSDLDDLEGRPPALPLAVVEAESTQDVARTLALTREARVPVVPYGGGSGVCGGVRTSGDCVVLSTERMTGLVELDGELPCRLKPTLRLFDQATSDDLRQVTGQCSGQLGYRRRRVSKNGGHHRRGTVTLKRSLPRRHLVEDDADGEDVRAIIHRLAFRLLG